MNIVILCGRLTAKPETSFTQGGKAVCKFTVAIDRATAGADFIRVTVWDKQAENCDRYLDKGSQVAVQGRLQTGSYKNNEGKTVYTQDVIANRVKFLTRPVEVEADAPKSEPAQATFDAFEAVADEIPF